MHIFNRTFVASCGFFFSPNCSFLSNWSSPDPTFDGRQGVRVTLGPAPCSLAHLSWTSPLLGCVARAQDWHTQLPAQGPVPRDWFFLLLVFSLFMSTVLNYNLHTITHIFSVTFDEFWQMSIPCETHTLIKTQNVFIIPETFLAALRSIFPTAHSRQPLIHFLSVFPFPEHDVDEAVQDGAFASDLLHSAQRFWNSPVSQVDWQFTPFYYRAGRQCTDIPHCYPVNCWEALGCLQFEGTREYVFSKKGKIDHGFIWYFWIQVKKYRIFTWFIHFILYLYPEKSDFLMSLSILFSYPIYLYVYLCIFSKIPIFWYFKNKTAEHNSKFLMHAP